MKIEKRQSRRSEENFLFGETLIEECKSYTYLGTVIFSNGKFKGNIQQLCKIASRTMYTLLSHTNKYSGAYIELLMDLFDKIIVPIYTYNSEVCGSAFFTKQYSCHSFLSENQQENPVEKIQISFLKHLLSVNSRSTNWAVLSETNSKPILCKIILKIERYWERIKESPSPILKAVLITNKQLQKEGKPSWLTGIGIMTEIFRANDMSPSANLSNLTSTIFKKLLDDEWHLNHKKYSKGKLKFYTSIKERPGFENYLNMGNPKFRQTITKFRISAHKFAIETGRYENKVQWDRIYHLCCEGIGNEINYLNECYDSVLAETRKALLKPF